MLSRWQSTIVDAQGNVRPFAILTILNEETQAPAQIYASESESQPLPDGTVVADESGYAYFYARCGRYRIQSGDLNIDWRHVPIGDAQAADILGAVADGAIIERGINDNGEYVKFADGTLICLSPPIGVAVPTGAGALFRSETETWTYPYESVTTPNIATTAGSINRWVGSNPSVASLDFRVFGTSSSDNPIGVRLTAFGRWF